MKKNRIEPYDETTHSGLVRHILTRVGFTTGEIMVCLVINGRAKDLKHSEELVAELTKIEGMTSIVVNRNQEATNKILGTEIETLWGRDYIEDTIGDVRYQIGPLSFYQVNPRQTRVLYGKALEFADLTGEETVWDLYCGIGTISLFLAQKAKQVYGVEIVPEAIEDAKKNAVINGMDNVEFFVGKAEEILPQKYKESHQTMYADVIVVDPPRKGCEESLLETIVQMEPKKVVYVSCDPATLARDLKYLDSHGYEVRKVQPVDMFGMGGHVEVVSLLSRV
jgi:23S rRNA (uracil1939-C5)-methyltransferase